MEKNSQPLAPAAPTAKVTPPANEPPKTQTSSNLEMVPVASRTAATDGSAAQPQRGTAVGSVPLRSVQQHPQPLSPQVPALAGTATGSMFGPTAQSGATMPRPPTAVVSLACRPVQQTNPVVFGQGSSSIQAVAAAALAATTHGTTAQHGAALRPTKLIIKRRPAPPPPKLPVYRPPPPPRPELTSSSAAGDALLLQSSSDTGLCVLNMQADPPSPDQVTTAEGSDSKGGSGSGDDVQMLDLNFPPVSNNKEN